MEMEGIKLRTVNFSNLVEKLEEKLKWEEMQENYEYCAFILSFKEFVSDYVTKKHSLTPVEVAEINNYLNNLKFQL